MMTQIISFVMKFLDKVALVLFPNYTTGFLQCANAINQINHNSNITVLKHWLSIVSYFVPTSIWKGFITASLVLVSFRIILAIFSLVGSSYGK